MNIKEFEKKLKECGLNKKEFAENVGMPYQTMMNWNKTDETPYWVEPFLENYIKAKNFDTVVDTVEPFVGKNPPKR